MPVTSETAVVQGREVTGADREQIRELIRAHPDWSRRRLSEVLAAEWDWRNAAGRLKDMAARSLLVKLDQRGWIQLPPRRWAATNRMRARVIARRRWDTTPLPVTLAELGPLEVREVGGDVEGRADAGGGAGRVPLLGLHRQRGRECAILDHPGKPRAGRRAVRFGGVVLPRPRPVYRLER